MVRCVDRLTVSPLCVKDDKCSVAGSLQTIVKLLENTQFQKLLDIHNIIQSVQCFQCPPAPLCCDAKILVREVSDYIIFSPSAYSRVLNLVIWGIFWFLACFLLWYVQLTEYIHLCWIRT